jgi:SAM-dependent methyltransferase
VAAAIIGEMIEGDEDRMRHEWDARARHAMRLYVATWYAHSDETWAEGARRDSAYLMRQLPPELGPGHACLDLGCGPGRLLPALAARFERVVGVDVSPEMLSQARSAVAGDARITLRLVDGRSLEGLPDGAFAFVLANAVFIHCEQGVIDRLLSEVGRVLAPGGLLAATFNSAEPPPAVPAHVHATDPAAGRRSPASAPASAMPVPKVSASDLELIGGPTWDGARFTRPALLAALGKAGLVPKDVQAMDTAWNVLAGKPR